MGNNLNVMNDQLEKKKEFRMLNLTLTKLREYYGSFKSICTNFSIDKQEFIEIFGDEMEEYFRLWDSIENGLIDALELFSGLVLFSNSNFDEKIRFLFDMYDFNDLNSLSLIDIEFMINSCLNSTFRIYNTALEVNQDEVNQFVNKALNQNKQYRINISQLIKWCQEDDEIRHFFTIIGKEPPERRNYSLNELVRIKEDSQYQVPEVFRKTKSENISGAQSGFIINQKTHSQKLEFVQKFLQKLNTNFQESMQIRDLKAELNWVYGFRCQDIAHCIFFHQSSKQQNEKLLYLCSSVVVIFYYQLRIQRHYTGHENEVVSLCIGSVKDIVASGEKGDSPSIHIWDIHSTQAIKQLQNLNIVCANLLKFINHDDSLIVVDRRHNSPIYIFDVESGQLITSCQANSFVFDIISIHNLQGFVPNQNFNQNDVSSISNRYSSSQGFMKEIGGSYKQSSRTNPLNITNPITITGDFNFQNKERSGFMTQQMGHKTRGGNDSFNNSRLVNSSRKKSTLNSLKYNTTHFNSKTEQDQMNSMTGGALTSRPQRVNLLSIDIAKNFFLLSQNCVFYFEYRGNNYLKKNIYYRTYITKEKQKKKIKKKSSKMNGGNATMGGRKFMNSTGKASNVLLCACSFYLNRKNSELRIFTEKNEDYENILFTGDSEGRLCQWRGFASDKVQIKELETYDRPITHLLYASNNKICVLTDNGVIDVRILSMKEGILNIDLTSLDLKLESLEVLDLIKGAKNDIFLATSEGEIVKIVLHTDKVWDKASFVNKVRAEQISSIVKLKGDLSSIVLVERQTDKLGFDCQNEKLVFVGGEQSVVYGFSAEEHELVDKWSVGDTISAMDTFINEDGGIVFAFGTKMGKIMLRFDWEEHPKHMEFQKPILHVRFSPNGTLLAALCENQHLYLFSNTNGTYFEFDPKEVYFDNEIPLTINFFDNSKAIIVGTSECNYYKLELPEVRNKDKIQDNEKFDVANAVLRYSLFDEKNYSKWNTFICGQEQKFIAGGDENGLLYLWKDMEQLKQNCGIALRSHCSRITDIKVSNNKDFVFSISKCDNTLLEWRIFVDTESSPRSNHNPIQSDDQLVLEKESLFCASHKEKIKFLKDSFGYFRACSIPLMNILFGNSREKIRDQKMISKRFCRSSLKLKKVYGFTAFDRRNTVFYGHHIQGISLNSLNLLEFLQKPELIESYRKINNDFNHRLFCERTYITFISRIGIVVRVSNINNQRFYEGHEEKISCLTLHPNKLVVATGEASFNPTIHIWLSHNCQQVSILNTYHKVGISCLKFSHKDNLLISLSVDNSYSIQITNWVNRHIIAFTKTSKRPLMGLEINPLNSNKFVVSGKSCVEFWEFMGNSLQRTQIVEIEDHQYRADITCMAYFCYYCEGQTREDIIIGTSIGSIGVISGNKLYLIEGAYHTKMVNCIKVAYIENFLVILTAGMDDLIKIFDKNFRQLLTINVRKKERKTNTALAVQSLDLFTCGDTNYLLFGSRCGEIVEHVIGFHIKKGKLKQSQPWTQRGKSTHGIDDQDGEEIEGIRGSKFGKKDLHMSGMMDKMSMGTKKVNSREMKCHKKPSKGSKRELSVTEGVVRFQSHASQFTNSSKKLNISRSKKVHITVHPTQDVMVSIGDDCNLIFWEINNGTALLVKYLTNYPTCCQFSPKGDYLVIGFKNGTLIIFEPIITVSRADKISIELTGDPWTIMDKETKNAVLNIEFSDNGDLMAVSYDNLKVNREEDDVLKEKEGAFVYVFIKKNSAIKNYKIQAENKYLYEKYTEIRLPSKNETQRVQSNVYGMAIYFMAFSSDNSYLMVYFQRVDNQQIRENRDRNGNYVVWDLSSNNLVTNDTIYNNVQFKKNNFPNHINARYRILSRKQDFLNLEGSNIENLLDALQNHEIGISAISNGIECSYLGSVNGEIFIVKNEFFSFDEVTVPEKLPLDVYCQGKMLQGHVSFVNQVLEKVSKRKKYLFSTGIHDEAIFQWEIKEADPSWELDHFQEYDKKVDDFFLMESDTRQKFDILVQEVHPLRKSISKIVQETDGNVFPAISLELSHIIGRRAFNRRKNLFLTRNKEIIYSVGAMLVLVKLKWNRKVLKLKNLQQWENLCFVSGGAAEDQPGQQEQNNSFISYSMDGNSINNFQNSEKSSTNSINYSDDIQDNEFVNQDNQLKQALGTKNLSEDQQSNTNYDFMSSKTNIFEKKIQGFHEKRQRFINSNIDGDLGVSEEITCQCLSPDKLTICVGVSQERASLRLWDVNTGSHKSSLNMPNCVTVTHIRYAFDNSTVVCLGTTSEYTSCVYLVNTSEENILALLDLKYSLVFKITDIEFVPNSLNQFLTVGILHCSMWTFNGGVLSFRELELKNIPSSEETFSEDDLAEDDEPRETLPLLATFLCIEFLSEDHFVVGDDKGFLYLFIEGMLDKKVKLLEDQAISVIKKCQKNSNLFFVGSFGGVLSLFKLLIQEREIDLLLVGQISLFKNAKQTQKIDSVLRQMDSKSNRKLPAKVSEHEEPELSKDNPRISKLKEHEARFKVLENGQNQMQREIQSIIFDRLYEVYVGCRSGDVFRILIHPKYINSLIENRESQRKTQFGQTWDDNMQNSGFFKSGDEIDKKPQTWLSRVDELTGSKERNGSGMDLRESINQNLQDSQRNNLQITEIMEQKENARTKIEEIGNWPEEHKKGTFYNGDNRGLDDSDEISEEFYNITVIYSFSDNEIPRACEFSSNSQLVFNLSELGLLNVYTIDQLDLVHQQHFHKKTVDMKVTNSHLIIAFEYEVMILQNTGNFKQVQKPISSNKQISYLKVSTDSNLIDWMALAFKQSAEYKPLIEIYKWKSKTFEKLTQIEIEHDVHFIDFSVDNFFMLYKDISGNFNFFSLKNHKKIETLGADFDTGIEWQSEGLRLSEKRKAIDRFYYENNPVMSLLKIPRKNPEDKSEPEALLVSDDAGTLRLFEYPCEFSGYYKVYSQHLNFIRNIKISECNNFVLSSSLCDKAIFIWKVNRHHPNDFKNKKKPL